MNGYKTFLEFASPEKIVEFIFNKNINFRDLKLKVLQKRLKQESLENDLKIKRAELLRTIDFKELKITNQEGRNAHCDKLLIEDQSSIDVIKKEIKELDIEISMLRRTLRLLDHIIDKYDYVIVNEKEPGSDFTTGDKIKENNLMGDPKASEYIIQAKEYLISKNMKVTVRNIKQIALKDCNDPNSALDKDHLKRVLKQLEIEGVK